MSFVLGMCGGQVESAGDQPVLLVDAVEEVFRQSVFDLMGEDESMEVLEVICFEDLIDLSEFPLQLLLLGLSLPVAVLLRDDGCQFPRNSPTIAPFLHIKYMTTDCLTEFTLLLP